MKIGKSIFTKLMVSFVFYAVLVVVTLILCLMLEAVVVGEGSPLSTQPYSLIDENGEPVNLDISEKIGGWAEELDENFNVINVYGEKKSPEYSYSQEEMLNITSPNGNTDYVGFYVIPENSPKRFLCLYDRNVMEIRPTLIVNGFSEYDTPDITWIFLPIAAGEILLISLYLKRKIKKPLDEIVSGMEDLRSGNSSARVNIRTEAEFERIVDTFNHMAEALERERAEKEELTRKKDQMLLELSHDIKTPVATIKSYSNALGAGLVPDEKKQEIYHIIEAKADRVHMLSEDMFTMLKMDNPQYNVELQRVNLCEYLRQLCAEYYDEITGAGFEFDILIPDDEITVLIDPHLFSRIISNLLSNAMKYNKSGRVISAELFSADGRVSVTVSDDGGAIDSELSDKLFDAFSRGDKARKTDGGTGLGLAISKLIARRHNGELYYERKNDMNCFTVMIGCADA
ncbi:MAG: ATP-binding protein [Oscillospiraceae bacterium]